MLEWSNCEHTWISFGLMGELDLAGDERELGGASRVVWQFAGRPRLVFNDPLCFGGVRQLSRAALAEKLGALGPDVMSAPLHALAASLAGGRQPLMHLHQPAPDRRRRQLPPR